MKTQWIPHRLAGAIMAILLAPQAIGCAAIATSPSWVGGGLATTGPLYPLPEEPVETSHKGPTPGQPLEIGARHILVMHNESASKPASVNRSRAEAQARAEECLKKLRGGADFVEMVKAYSDEPGAGARGGSLGLFKREVMVPDFSNAAFALKVDEVSEVVATDFGFHIIKRTK